ncbi:iron ABC transporter ATP-binding protein [Mesorhizobium sp. Root552]|nr:ABC transporter ATP-binding protein [Mesorhizobium sp. Root552]KQZ31876.1 iron ABC transporter ATP-binding protein [Mesorhizobium sp. Root552]
MLQIAGAFRRFSEEFTLGPLDLAIEPQEIICLVGHSGCGKSSLLRLIAGLDRAERGSIRLDGVELAGPNTFVEPEERQIGFVFQDYALFPHLSVEENILFGLGRLPRPEAQKRVADMLALTGLSALGKRYPHMLSGGEQQRVALARALAPKPAVLLMDEPFSNLDRDLRDRIRQDTIDLLRKTGTTAVIVTHDPEEALSSGDRVVLMKSGLIVQAGTGRELHDRPVDRYAAEFFCSFNKVPATYRSGHLETALGRFPCRLDLADGSSAVAFIRPQAISPSRDRTAIAGSILRRSFRGEIEQIELAVPGNDGALIMRTTQPTEGDHISVVIDPSRVLAFAA